MHVYLSIEFACGKVPLRAHRKGGGAKEKVRKPGALGILSRCFAESVFETEMVCLIVSRMMIR